MRPRLNAVGVETEGESQPVCALGVHPSRSLNRTVQEAGAQHAGRRLRFWCGACRLRTRCSSLHPSYCSATGTAPTKPIASSRPPKAYSPRNCCPQGLAPKKRSAPAEGAYVMKTFLRHFSARAVTNGSARKRSHFAAITSPSGSFIEDSVEICRCTGEVLTKPWDLLTKSM